MPTLTAEEQREAGELAVRCADGRGSPEDAARCARLYALDPDAYGRAARAEREATGVLSAASRLMTAEERAEAGRLAIRCARGVGTSADAARCGELYTLDPDVYRQASQAEHAANPEVPRAEDTAEAAFERR